jgi:valyl-tRNA synthetase
VNSLVLLGKLEPGSVRILDEASAEAAALKADQSQKNVRLVVQDGMEVYLPMSGLVDAEKEKARLLRQESKLQAEIEKLEKRLNPAFVGKAPAAVVEKARAELAELVSQADKVKDSLAKLG